MSAPRPGLAIGLPVLGGETHLAAALEALPAQSFADFELIVSDDASTDGTRRSARRVDGGTRGGGGY